jgi:hypothetical protein
VPATLRAKLDGTALTAEARQLYAALELRRGVLYFSAPAFARAAELASTLPGDPVAELVLALGGALESAPKDAAALMLSSPRLSGPLGSLEPLAAIAKKKGRFAAEAEFDAAYLSLLTPPDNDPKFWADLAQRFTRAAQGLRAATPRSLALELAESARKTAEAVRNTPATGAAPTPAAGSATH